MPTISKNQLKGLIMILGIAKNKLKNDYDKYLSDKLHREMSQIQEEQK